MCLTMGDGLGKRGPKKGHGKGGRPRKKDTPLRRYWRKQKRKRKKK